MAKNAINENSKDKYVQEIHPVPFKVSAIEVIVIANALNSYIPDNTGMSLKRDAVLKKWRRFFDDLEVGGSVDI